MNAITPRTASSAVAALGGLKAGLQNVATSVVTAGGDPYLRLLKDGSWVYGQENVEVEANSEWAVNPLSLMHGFVVWSDYKKKSNEILGEVMVPAAQALPARSDLRETTDDEGNKCDWNQQLSMQFQCLTGEDIGTQVLYKTTSVGGMNACKALINAIVKQLETDPENPVPVVTLESSHYNHTKYGKTYVPELTIVDWVPLDDQIKDPIKADTPDSDTKAPQAEAQQVRTRERGASVAQQTTAISDADRKAALDGALADAVQERAEAAPEQPRRRRR